MKMRSKKIDRVFAVIFALLLLAALLSPIYVGNDEQPMTVACEPSPSPVNVNAAGQAGEHVDSAVAWRWYSVP